MLRQLPELESCIVMWLNLDLLPCMVTGSWIDLDLPLTGSQVPGYINTCDVIPDTKQKHDPNELWIP